MAATQHRTGFFLTSDMKIEFTIFDRGTSQVPAETWEAFADSYRREHGTSPASSLTDYIINHCDWYWDTTYTSGAVVIGEADGPIGLELESHGPEGCQIVYWGDGAPYDTGLRVWAGEAAKIARLLEEKADRGD